jgi:hypothetical protein
MNADYWEERTALIRDGAVPMLTLSGFEEVDYWREELKSNRRNSREIELMTWARNAVTLRGRANYGRVDRPNRGQARRPGETFRDTCWRGRQPGVRDCST